MLVQLRHQSQAIFADDPSRLVAVFMILESMVHWNSCHPNIYTWFQRITFWIEPQNRRMLGDVVAQQDHIHVVVKQLFVFTRWFLPFQFAGH